MTTYTERTQAWLDQRSVSAVAESLRAGHEPLYQPGGGVGHMPVGHVVGLARSSAILNALATVEFESCLDVGSGEGRLGHLIGQLYGARCVAVDLVRDFAVSVRRDFGFPAYVANAAVLPFADQQFDLVLCSEVLEHVEHPFAVLGELWRVARRAVVITTQEVCRTPWHRRLQMAAVERAKPHAERNYFLPDDFRPVFGDGVEIRALLHLPERVRLFPRRSSAELAACLRALAVGAEIGPGSFGVLVIARKCGTPVPPRLAAEAVIEAVLDADRRLDTLAARRVARPFGEQAPPVLAPPVLAPAVLAPAVLAPPVLAAPLPVCPECTGALLLDAEDTIHCAACQAKFAAHEGVPRLLASPAAVAQRDGRWAHRAELEPLRRALQQRPLPLRTTRRTLRWALKIIDFLRLPLSWSDKGRLAWRFLRRS